ncbi:DNA ligase-associated metallophosphoesterase [Lewinella marina]|uniref:Metallophosphoesterase n=1 Tax=Neolewinella marina TaxID=438751 RepID=A0A2G0CGH3_9BACT|nr:ligase-associated DNA damage response endonuclease PdeM [Neolewinella marina]NJB86467.1 DNA ligase-associated metallophosphoesterase [Neolewinella marina]PHK99073.1 metallophosphoesterase [Neolewinella marina]
MESVTIAGEQLQLHPDRAIYWPARSILLLADLHLGKGAHFRRAGIPVPRGVSAVNFARLHELLRVFRPRRVLLLGDLFHSDHNHVWRDFCDFTTAYPDLSFELVPGNHDVLPPTAYAEASLVYHPEIITEGAFSFSHHPLKEDQRLPGHYNLCGHVHPCVKLLDGSGRGMKLPAFYFGVREGILPAFGEFTGCAEVKVRPGDRVFVLAEQAVLPVH